MGMSEAEVLDRLKKLKTSGIIRRIGAVIDPKSIGLQSTLCAADVPMNRLEEFAAAVGAYDEVTHHYLREGHPNCWFTIIAPSMERLHQNISEIEQKLGIEIQSLPARNVFKIRVAFDIE
jgi:DNA-binding Lrp family transcriptional regulator